MLLEFVCIIVLDVRLTKTYNVSASHDEHEAQRGNYRTNRPILYDIPFTLHLLFTRNEVFSFLFPFGCYLQCLGIEPTEVFHHVLGMWIGVSVLSKGSCWVTIQKDWTWTIIHIMFGQCNGNELANSIRYTMFNWFSLSNSLIISSGSHTSCADCHMPLSFLYGALFILWTFYRPAYTWNICCWALSN